MALKKWVFGTRLSQQITEQNENIDTIDTFMNNIKDAPLVLGKESVGVNVVPPANSKGLWIKDSLINGNQVASVISLEASTSQYPSGDYGAVIKGNWNKLPGGVTLVRVLIGSFGVGLINKYDGAAGNSYGSFIVFGYAPDGGKIKRYMLNDGNWSEVEA